MGMQIGIAVAAARLKERLGRQWSVDYNDTDQAHYLIVNWHGDPAEFETAQQELEGTYRGYLIVPQMAPNTPPVEEVVLEEPEEEEEEWEEDEEEDL